MGFFFVSPLTSDSYVRTFCGLDGSQMFQMQMMVQLSRRTALGLAVGLWTDIMVYLWTWEKCTRLMLRPVIDECE